MNLGLPKIPSWVLVAVLVAIAAAGAAVGALIS